jgi:uncharacterized protein YjdB
MKLTSKVVLASIAAAGSVSALAGIVQDQSLVAPEVSIVAEAATPVSCQTSNVGQGKLKFSTPVVTDASVALKWNSLKYGGKTYYYEVIRVDDATKAETIIYQGANTSYTDTTFTKGKSYTYKVQDMYQKDVPSGLAADMVCTPGNASHTFVTTAVKTSAAVAIKSISINKNIATVKTGKTQSLIANVSPGNATDKSVVWSSANPLIATVDATGKVTGIKSGVTSIIAKNTASGIQTSSTIIVN